MKPKIQERLSFENEVNCLVDYCLLEKAMIWWANGNILKRKRIIYMHGSYAGVSIFYEKLHVHRLIFSYVNQNKFPRNIHIHHKNGNKLNNRIENLEAVHASIHLSRHNKGKILGAEQRQIISESNRKRKGGHLPLRRPDISIDKISSLLNRGYAINKIAKCLRTDWSTIRNRIHDKDLLK